MGQFGFIPYTPRSPIQFPVTLLRLASSGAPIPPIPPSPYKTVREAERELGREPSLLVACSGEPWPEPRV